MSGLVAILGGQEHLPGVEPVDRRLLAESGMRRPTVAVLLAATVPARIRAKIAESLAYWPRLGARVRFAYTGVPGETEQALDVLTDPDLVVLTGGRPWLIQRRLTAPIVERLLCLSDDGVPLSGSSAGAMALGTWRVDLRPNHVPRMRAGLGLVPGAAAPHYGRHGLHHASRVFAHRHPYVPFLGLQDRTALVGRDGSYEVMGAGSATILHGDTRRHYPAGGQVTLERTPAPVATRPVAVEPAGAGSGRVAVAPAGGGCDAMSTALWQPAWTVTAMTDTMARP